MITVLDMRPRTPPQLEQFSSAPAPSIHVRLMPGIGSAEFQIGEDGLKRCVPGINLPERWRDQLFHLAMKYIVYVGLKLEPDIVQSVVDRLVIEREDEPEQSVVDLCVCAHEAAQRAVMAAEWVDKASANLSEMSRLSAANKQKAVDAIESTYGVMIDAYTWKGIGEAIEEEELTDANLRDIINEQDVPF